jgi:hypothetical protein
MGFPSLSVAAASKDPRAGFNCLMAVAQDQDAVMYEHFLRKEADVSTAKVDGRKTAIEGSIGTLRKLIVEAITAPDVAMGASDGGGLHADNTVSLRYFLLGRALHLVQDSFSYEHAKRRVFKGKVVVDDIHSYRCVEGATEHTHTPTTRLSTALGMPQGDYIWAKASNHPEPSEFAQHPNKVMLALKPNANQAVLASADLWKLVEGFSPQKVDAVKMAAAIDAYRDKWFSYTPLSSTPATNRGEQLKACRAKMTPAEAIEKQRDACLKAIGPNNGKLSGPGYTFSIAEAHKVPFRWDEALLKKVQ